MPMYGPRPSTGASSQFAPLTFTVSTPASVWGPFQHGLGFIPISMITKLADNVEIIGQNTATSEQVTVVFNQPYAGTLLVR